MKKTLLVAFLAVLSILLLLISDKAFSKGYEPAGIRVAVIKDASRIDLTVKGRYKIFSLYTHRLLSEGKDLRKKRIAPTISGLLIGKDPFKIFGIRIEPNKDASIFINKRRFRGCLDIIRTEDLKLLAVNHIDVESYLYGVLYHEVSPRWTMEALKSQAIIARTFAIYEARMSKAEDYDVTSDVYSQVYGGRTSEKYRTTRAVKLTKGKILTYRGDIFPTYYHATCAGHTEDASMLWSINIEPLKGVKCSWCRKAPHYRWRKKILLSKIEKALKKKGYNIKGISSISIEGIDKSGRISNLILKGNDSSLKISSNKFRLAVGPNIIRSANFEVTVKKNTAHFEGLGWGHGVGLCQWGSYLMSREGYNANEVLKFYYPGSQIKDISELK